MTLKTIRHTLNPFVENMLIPVGTKNVRISSLGKDANILVNHHTGEISGTHVVAHKKVDTGKFVKTFADYMAFTFDLTKAGNKALRIVMWAMKEQSIGKDIVLLDKYTYEAFLSAHGFSDMETKESKKPSLSYPTFTRGLAELERSKIIAKTVRIGFYFINPNCMFNGDRIAFTTLIERQEPEEEKQLSLLPA